MDEKNLNGAQPTPEKPSAGSKKNLDAFFQELDSSGALEGDAAKRPGEDRYNPDYIDLGDYEKSDTGFVSLREKSPEVRSFDSEGADKTAGSAAGKADAKKTPQKGAKTAASSAGGKKKKNAKAKGGEVKHRGWRIFGKVVLYVACIGVICICAVTVAASMYLAKETANDDALLDLNSLKLSFATRLMAQNEDGEWYEYQRMYEDANRIWVEYDDLSPELIAVTVSSEDQRFWTHKGVDIKRTLVAFLNEYVLKGYFYDSTQGGSTITQQLIKNITEEDAVAGSSGALRKLKEIYRAFMLERKYSKNQILEAYLNTVNFGGQVEGIEAAANYYFNTTASDLTYAQSAAIVCITKFPTANNPFLNPEENRHQREDVVLWTMYETQKAISEADYKAALAESKTFVFDEPGSSASSANDNWSWFSETVRDEVMRDLQEINGMTYAEAHDLFYNGGLTIYLTIDPSIQQAVESVAYDEKYWNNDIGFNSYASSTTENTRIWPLLEYEDEKDENGDYVLDAEGNRVEKLADNQIQAAMVVMNMRGELLGVAGSIRTKEGNLALNRAVGTIEYIDADGNVVDKDDPNMYTYRQVGGVRQTGSSMKPIAVYAPALELDKITCSTLFADQPVTTIAGNPWPRNYSRNYGAPVTVSEGLVRSLNTTAASAMMLIGYDYSYDFLTTSLGITTMVDNVPSPYDHSHILSDRGLSLGLGGLSVGVSPYEMAAAYAVFGNGGTYYEPHCYTRILDARGDIVINKEDAIQVNKALSDETAMIMNKIMQGVTTGTFSGATGTNMRRYGNDRFPIAAKTGTSSDDNDFWAIGMNPYYVMAVWEGYDQYESMSTLRPHPTQQAFALVMSQISADLDDSVSFPTSDNVTIASFCTASGDLASDACPDTRTGYYKKGTLPPTCDHSLVPSQEELDAMDNQPG